jgi:hypothetical protein
LPVVPSGAGRLEVEPPPPPVPPPQAAAAARIAMTTKSFFI